MSVNSGCAIGSHWGWNIIDGDSTIADAVGGVQGNIDAPAVCACLCTDALCIASEASIAARARSAWSCISKSASHNVTFFLSARADDGVNQINLT
jgi:hypothetical protein